MHIVQQYGRQATLPPELLNGWLEGKHFPWPTNPKHSYHDDRRFREQLKLRLSKARAEDVAQRLLSHVKHCTAEQLTALQGTMLSQDYTLAPGALDYAVIEFSEQGSLSKLQALYPNLVWEDLESSLGIHESLSGKNMRLYAKDIIAFFHETAMDDNAREGAALLMMAALQQNPLANSDVIKIMDLLPKVDLGDHSNFIQATDTAVSLLYDTTPELVETNAPKLASQLQRLHEGWGMKYPAAAMAILMQKKHTKPYYLPKQELLTYATGKEDFQLAQLLLGQRPNAMPDEAAVVGRIRMMQQLYEPEAIMSAMLAGDESFIAPSEVYTLPNDENLFQDVGQP